MTPKLLVFAHPQEAAPFIEKYSCNTLFQLKTIQCLYSENNQIYFLITSGGAVNTSVALSVFFERFSTLKNNILCFNIGIAGSFNKPIYHWHYISKITNYHNNKSFYPDIFIKANYAEIMTIEFPANKKIMSVYPDVLFDMEAFAFANTLKFFVQNHQIHCIKFVSDNDGVIKDIHELLSHYQKQLSEALNIIQDIENIFTTKLVQNADTEKELKIIIESLPVTQSQQSQFKKAAVYYLQHNGSLNQIRQIINEHHLHTIKIKSEKNSIFRKILNQLYNV
ncbi:MAG: hypothetical protein N2203_01155 [Bacteroidia bacterium]|nr:hypothetical protein [Bacteroidia bacterium]